jgi:hypothetical protein
VGRGYNLIHLVEQLPSVVSVRGSSINLERYIGGRSGGRNWKRFSGLRAVISFINLAPMSRIYLFLILGQCLNWLRGYVANLARLSIRIS